MLSVGTLVFLQVVLASKIIDAAVAERGPEVRHQVIQANCVVVIFNKLH